MKISIVIPYYKNEDTIDALIHSLEDQDFKDWDATIVIDGKDEIAYKRLGKLYWNEDGTPKGDNPIYVEMLEKNQGAPAARNFGAEISGQNLLAKNKGNILFFIDADCRLYPGILREVDTQFEDNPEIEFVYGNYRFENSRNYISLPYDPYRLKTMNFISTMSPIKRDAFIKAGKFKDAPHFQDWSLFYRASEKGLKGKYVNEYFFTTEIPGEDSISGTKGLTLSDKASVFRKEHNIADKTLVVTSWGADYQALQRAKILGADFVCHNMGDSKVMPLNYSFDNWMGTYMVGCYSETPNALATHMSSTVGKPIFHFIGTDVFQMINRHPVVSLKQFREKFDEINAKIFVNSPRCLEEMKDCGFKDAELLYTPIYNQKQYSWLVDPPKQFTVAVYYSDDSPMMKLDGGNGHSNLPMIMEVAKAMPDIKFKFFGGHRKFLPEDISEDVGDNIEFCGRIEEKDMCAFINSCSMIVRSTIHDGFPQLPIQFLLCGRQALVSCPDMEMNYANKLLYEEIFEVYDDARDDVINKIYEMEKSPSIFKTKVEEIHDYYSELMSVAKFREEIYKCL